MAEFSVSPASSLRWTTGGPCKKPGRRQWPCVAGPGGRREWTLRTMAAPNCLTRNDGSPYLLLHSARAPSAVIVGACCRRENCEGLWTSDPRWALVAVGSLAAIAPCPSHAEVYRPWCAQYYDSNSGATNCGFVSYEQCMATARGGGAWCVQNPWYARVSGSADSSSRIGGIAGWIGNGPLS